LPLYLQRLELTGQQLLVIYIIEGNDFETSRDEQIHFLFENNCIQLTAGV
jgi:hypothetical protein